MTNRPEMCPYCNSKNIDVETNPVFGGLSSMEAIMSESSFWNCKCKDCGKKFDADMFGKVKRTIDKNEFLGLPAEGSGMTYHVPVRAETSRCSRCGLPKRGEPKTIWGSTYYICRLCDRDAKEYAEEVANLYLRGESDYFMGFKAKHIPELKRLFAQSESEDIRKMVEFLEGVEADIWPKEEEE